MAEVVEPQLGQSGSVSQITPRSIPLLSGPSGIKSPPLSGKPDIVRLVSTPHHLSPCPHLRKRLPCGLVEWYNPVATLVLAARDPNHTLDQVNVSPLQVLHLNWPERGIRGHDCCEIDRLPIGITAGDLQESVLFFVG